MNKSPVSSKLQCMFAFGPAEVVDDVVHRHAVNRFAVLRVQGRSQGIDEAEVGILARRCPGRTVTLANVAIAQVVDKVRGEYKCVTGRNALRVVDLRISRGLARELLDSTECVFL